MLQKVCLSPVYQGVSAQDRKRDQDDSCPSPAPAAAYLGFRILGGLQFRLPQQGPISSAYRLPHPQPLTDLLLWTFLTSSHIKHCYLGKDLEMQMMGTCGVTLTELNRFAWELGRKPKRRKQPVVATLEEGLLLCWGRQSLGSSLGRQGASSKDWPWL